MPFVYQDPKTADEIIGLSKKRYIEHMGHLNLVNRLTIALNRIIDIDKHPLKEFNYSLDFGANPHIEQHPVKHDISIILDDRKVNIKLEL